MTPQTHGGVFLLLSDRHVSDLEERIDRSIPFTDVVDRDLSLAEVQPCVVATAESGIVAVAMLIRGRNFVTTARSVKLSDARLVGPWELGVVSARMQKRSATWLTQVRATSAVPPATWDDLVTAIATLDPDAGRLLGLRPTVDRPGREISIQREERDAVLLSLELAGLERPSAEWPIDPDHHFLAGAETAAVLEEHIVSHDALTGLPGWDRDIDPPRAYGFSDAFGRRLTVANVGGDKPERQMGVDLIYWREVPDAFVLVQYKRLGKEGSAWRYRPSADSNFKKELERMRTVMADLTKMAASPTEPAAYRLMDEPFFFKFCHPIQPTRRPGELMKGMYVPLAYWDVMDGSGVLTGPKGGVSVGYDNVPRWLSNSLFAELVGDAWLGTSGKASTHLAALIRSSLGLGRSVVLGVEHPRPERRSWRTGRASTASIDSSKPAFDQDQDFF